MKPRHACRFLQNKAWFVGSADVPAGEEPPEPRPLSTPFWCLKTHEAFGPDDDVVSDECCTADRPCFEPEVEL